MSRIQKNVFCLVNDISEKYHISIPDISLRKHCTFFLYMYVLNIVKLTCSLVDLFARR